MKAEILVVDDDRSNCIMLDAVLSEDGYGVTYVHDGSDAVDLTRNKNFDLILMDIRMKKTGGVEALSKIMEEDPDAKVIMMTAYASVETAVEAMKMGAYDYLGKPLDTDELKFIIEKALDHKKLENENKLLKERIDAKFSFENIIGKSAPMMKLFENISLVAPSDATVLIYGESGTGKEMIANSIHEYSSRKKYPFVKVNCAALPETLLESELFGHEKGAFTGAVKDKKGRFSLADKGSIFLDEISEISPNTQVKLLRVLQEHEIQPVGSSKTIKVDIRVVAASNRDLKDLVENHSFREDLFYRLNVIKLHIPPLRERGEDIILLADHFLSKFSEKNMRSIKGFKSEVYDIFSAYKWPGNVRELENCIERAVILCRGEYIMVDDLPEYLRSGDKKEDIAGNDISHDGNITLKDMEKKLILSTLEKLEGHRTKTADALGISRRKLQIKLKEYGINT